MQKPLSRELMKQAPAQRYGAGLTLVGIKGRWIVAEDAHGLRYSYDTSTNPNDKRIDWAGPVRSSDEIMESYANRLFILGEVV